MAGENVRSRGVVARFNDQKGYGFIRPDEGGDDLFVHHSEINCDGFRTLHADQVVEFLVEFDSASNKTKAVDVTGINGSSLDKVRNGRVVVAVAVVLEVVPLALIAVGLGTSREIARVFVPVAEEVEVVIRVESMGTWQGIVRTEVLVAAVEGVVVPGGLEAVEVNASAVGMKDILLENALTTHENNSN